MIENIAAESSLIDENLKEGLKGVLDKLTEDVTIKAVLDMETDKGKEMAGFLAVIASLSGRITLEAYAPEEGEKAEGLNQDYLPAAGFYKDGAWSGIAFHGVPGGQEIISFVLALYNLAGPGQDISRWTRKKIEKLTGKVNIKICVSLACHHCPKVVTACQHMAALNEGIEAEMIDANLYPELVDKYKIQRVPMTILNDEEIVMGVKTIEEMADIVKKLTKKK